MRSAPTLATRLLTWLAVLGLVCAGAWSARMVEGHGDAEQCWGSGTPETAKFVASLLDGGVPVLQPRLHKDRGWAACPPTVAGVFASPALCLARSIGPRGRVVFRGPSLVGVVELRI